MPPRINTALASMLADDVMAIHAPALSAMPWGLSETPEQAAVHGATERAVARRAGAVEVIPVMGVITNRPGILELLFGFGTSVQTLSRQINAAAQNPDVKAIVLDVDSPGGTVPGIPELSDEIYGLRGSKPIIAQVNGLAASAAYWIASAADEIVAGPSALVGSIGVFTVHQDVSAALEQEGIKPTVITSTPEKTEDHPFLALSEDARANIQARVDYFNDLFVKSVARGRGVSPAVVRESYGKGRVMAAAQALSTGMIDKIRTMPQTLAAYGVDVNTPQPRNSAMARRQREVALLTT